MDQKRKKAAAIAAVTAYIKTEEEALCMQSTALDGGAPAKAPAPAGPANLWGISGRQTLMQLGNMMQLKAFHRF
jgi:hypothetical protein